MTIEHPESHIGPDDTIRIRAGDLKEPRGSDWLIRFAFGAGVSAIAAVVGKLFGPQIGGLFLAFPATLLASLTLVAKDDGPKLALDEARGATLGALGLVAFAIVGASTIHRWPVWAALATALGAWAVVAFGGYLIVRRLGHGGDD